MTFTLVKNQQADFAAVILEKLRKKKTVLVKENKHIIVKRKNNLSPELGDIRPLEYYSPSKNNYGIFLAHKMKSV